VHGVPGSEWARCFLWAYSRDEARGRGRRPHTFFGENAIATYNLCLLGFGNVNRALVRLLHQRQHELRDRYQIEWRITGVASRGLGWIASPDGLDPAILTDPNPRWEGMRQIYPCPVDVRQWLRTAQANVLFEATSLNARTGQPAIDHIRAALESGAHAITANKGTIVHGYEKLRDLAAERKKCFLFESTVMDGAPIFSLFRETLPVVHLRAFHGILNSTTNLILTDMEQGLSFENSVKKAQQMGLAETDASDDVDGWDAAVKVVALVRVLMGIPLAVESVEREGIRSLSAEIVRAARRAGTPYKLVCRAWLSGSGVKATVRPEQVPLTDPMAHVMGTSSVVYFETDVLPGLAIVENNPGIETTAYGMLADFIRAAKLE
jgi:homoserine dehydrogenase